MIFVVISGRLYRPIKGPLTMKSRPLTLLAASVQSQATNGPIASGLFALPNASSAWKPAMPAAPPFCAASRISSLMTRRVPARGRIALLRTP